MIVGGSPDPAHGKCELIDLTSASTINRCPNINDYPVDSGSVGTFINGRAMVCGGRSAGNFYSECYSYNTQVRG